MSDTTALTSPRAPTAVDSADPASVVQLSALRKAGQAEPGSAKFPGTSLEHFHLHSWRTPSGALLLHLGTEEVLLPPEGFISLSLVRSAPHGRQIDIRITTDSSKDEWTIRLTVVGIPSEWREYGPPKASSTRRRPRQTPSPEVRAKHPAQPRTNGSGMPCSHPL